MVFPLPLSIADSLILKVVVNFIKSEVCSYQLESIKEILVGNFHFVRAFDMPFLIREHRRFYQWGIAEASIWHRGNQ